MEDGAQAAKRGVEIEKDSGFSDFNRQREREATQRDVQKLKDSIQVVIFPLLIIDECFFSDLNLFPDVNKVSQSVRKINGFPSRRCRFNAKRAGNMARRKQKASITTQVQL